MTETQSAAGEGSLHFRYVPEQREHRSQFKRGFMQGRVRRQEQEEKEALYRERWPGYLQQLRKK